MDEEQTGPVAVSDGRELAAHLLGLAALQGRVLEAGLAELEQTGALLEEGSIEILDRLHTIANRFGFQHLLNGADPYDDTAVDFAAIMREVLRADRARQAIVHIARILRACASVQADLAAAAERMYPDVAAEHLAVLARVREANSAAGMSDLRERMAAVIEPEPQLAAD